MFVQRYYYANFDIIYTIQINIMCPSYTHKCFDPKCDFEQKNDFNIVVPPNQ